jgi:sec-independent protein translocase protein TatA
MPDWAIVAIIAVVVLFGASKLPDIARNLGRSSGEFKKGLKEGHDGSAEGAATPPATDTSDGAPGVPRPTTPTPSPTPTVSTPTESAPDEPRSENPA